MMTSPLSLLHRRAGIALLAGLWAVAGAWSQASAAETETGLKEVAELAQVFNLAPQHLPPFPHFSYQIAPRYHRAAPPEALAQLARRHAPLLVPTSGLGLFPGDDPVLYLPLVRTASVLSAILAKAGLAPAR